MNYHQLNQEISNIINGNFSQSDSNAFLSQSDTYKIICVSKNTAYQEQLPIIF